MQTVKGWHGEFGLKLRFWIPQVTTLCGKEPTHVTAEPGNEALFPLAKRITTAEATVSDNGRGAAGRPPDLGVPETRVPLSPYEMQGVKAEHGSIDWVVCPRFREYGASKNWDAWPQLAHSISRLGRVFAAGLEETSYPIDPDAAVRAWDYDRELDATIEAMKMAKGVIATDAGLAHLAVLLGVPLILVTYRDKVAPGPVIDSKGNKAADEYWQPRAEYYEGANWTGSPIIRCDAWERPANLAAPMQELASLAGT